MISHESVYLATTADDAVHMAQAFGVNLEIDEYCIASNMDEGVSECWHNAVRQMSLGYSPKILHAPFSDISPACIDPLAVGLAKLRLQQAYRTATRHGIDRLIVHSGYVPLIHDRDSFYHRSVRFWKSYMVDKPKNFRLMIENEMEENPLLLLRLIQGIGDPRVGLCLNLGHAFLHPEFSLEDWVTLSIPHLLHVQLNDNDGVYDRHWPLGDGRLPVESALNILLDAIPDLTYTIDTLLTKPSLQWLKAQGYLGMATSPIPA